MNYASPELIRIEGTKNPEPLTANNFYNDDKVDQEILKTSLTLISHPLLYAEDIQKIAIKIPFVQIYLLSTNF